MLLDPRNPPHLNPLKVQQVLFEQLVEEVDVKLHLLDAASTGPASLLRESLRDAMITENCLDLGSAQPLDLPFLACNEILGLERKLATRYVSSEDEYEGQGPLARYLILAREMLQMGLEFIFDHR